MKHLLTDFVQDLRYALKLFGKAPGFAAVAVSTLALGIGANTAVFSVVDAVLLRPLPYRNPERLVVVWNRNVQHQGAGEPGPSKLFQGYRDFEEYARRVESFDAVSVATWAIGPQLWRGRGPAREIFAMPVGASFFTMLGVQASLGRTFVDDDERAGCSVVLSHRFWQNELAGQSDIVGETLDLGRRACTVRGVMPQDFEFYPAAAQLWTVLGPDFLPAREQLGVGVFARLKAGATLEHAQAEVEALYAAVHRNDGAERDLSPVVYPLQQEFAWLASRTLRTTLIALSGAVAVVLLITCLNVASLLLGRSTGRARELAVRAAIGAGRPRLLRQLLGEGLLLSAIGSGLGVLVAIAAIRYFRYANPIELPPAADVAIHWRTLIFTAVLAIATTVAFGLLPAWRASLVNPGQALKAGGRGPVRGTSGNGLLRILVLGQVALSVALLGAAALLLGSVVRMSSEPLGFDPDRLFTTRIGLAAERYPDEARMIQFYRGLEDRLASVPGLQSAGLGSDTTFGGSPSQEVEIAGHPALAERRAPDHAVSAGYFGLYKIPVVQGRAFTTDDRAESEPVAIVNAVLARRYLGGEMPIGQRIRLGASGKQGPWLTIVGVVGDVKGTSLYREMSWTEADPTVFRPLAQSPRRVLSLAFRTAAGLDGAGARVQHQIAQLDSEIAINEIVPANRWISKQLTYPYFRSLLFGVLAALALVLAAVGLYGILWQFVEERKQELALRMALGASRSHVLWLVTRYGGVPVILGLAAGIMLSAGAARFISGFLYDVHASDLRVLAAVSLTMLAVTVVALGLPARRATGIDPMAALREE